MAAAVAGSQLFCPFRALGFVANHVPLTLQTQGTETLVTTAVGSAFHVYNVGQFCVFSCTISLKRNSPYLHVKVCTVDRFSGWMLMRFVIFITLQCAKLNLLFVGKLFLLLRIGEVFVIMSEC